VRPSNKLRLKQRVLEEDEPKVQALLNPKPHDGSSGLSARADENVRDAVQAVAGSFGSQGWAGTQPPADNAKKRKRIIVGDKDMTQKANVRHRPQAGTRVLHRSSDFDGLDEARAGSPGTARAYPKDARLAHSEDLEDVGASVRDVRGDGEPYHVPSSHRLGYAHMVQLIM
jgi:hypothetical protein